MHTGPKLLALSNIWHYVAHFSFFPFIGKDVARSNILLWVLLFISVLLLDSF